MTTPVQKNISATSPVIYWLDQQDRIIGANEEWDEFARQNDGNLTFSTSVLGKPLWDYIHGDPTRMWVKVLLSYARLTSKVVKRSYRCDSPGLKRYMEMVITPENRTNLCLEHITTRVDKVEPAVRFKPSKSTQRAVFRCSICNLVWTGVKWIEPHIVAQEEFSEKNRPIIVAYTVCESCQGQLPGLLPVQH